MKRITIGRSAAFLGVAAFCSVPLRWQSPHHFHAPVMALLPVAWLLGTGRGAGLLDRARDRVAPAATRHLHALLPLAALLTCGTAAWIVFDFTPHVPDEMAYLFQAKVFAAGHWWVPDPGSDAFALPWTVTYEGRWFSIFPPGWPMLLALGVAAGLPWLVNPLLGGIALVTLHELLRTTSDAGAARTVPALLLLSPFFVFQGGLLMSHPAALACQLACALALARAEQAGAPGPGHLLAGASAGLLGLVRPQEVVPLLATVVVVLVWRHGPRALGRLARVGLGGLPFAALLVVYQHELTGMWFFSPTLLADPRARFGFGAQVGIPEWGDNFAYPGHTPWRSVLNLNHNLTVLASDLFGWPGLSLLPAVVFLCFGRWGALHHVGALHAVLVAGVYAGYWYHGVCAGARFYHALLPWLALCTRDGLVLLADAAAEVISPLARIDGRRLVGAAVATLFLVCTPLYVLKMAAGPYHHFLGIRSRAGRFLSSTGIEEGILFVRPPDERLAPAILLNEFPLGSAPLLAAYDFGDAANAELARRFPGRPIYYHKGSEPKPSDVRRWLEKKEMPQLLGPTSPR